MLSKEFSWYDTIKNIVKDVIKGSKFTSFFIGTVESTNPIKIKRDEKFILEESDLKFTNAVKEIELEIEVMDWETERELEHTHKIKSKRKVKINNALKKGEQVLVLQNQGGKEFIVLERVNIK